MLRFASSSKSTAGVVEGAEDLVVAGGVVGDLTVAATGGFIDDVTDVVGGDLTDVVGGDLTVVIVGDAGGVGVVVGDLTAVDARAGSAVVAVPPVFGAVELAGAFAETGADAVAGARVALTAVVVAGGLPVVPGLAPFREAAFTLAVLAAVAESTFASLPPGIGSIGSEPSFVRLCFELESLSLLLFLLGFFMFRTTFPDDFTGARLVFAGMVAIPGFGNTFASATGAVLVDVVSLLDVNVGAVVLSVACGSQRPSHLHGLLLLTAKPVRKIEKYD